MPFVFHRVSADVTLIYSPPFMQSFIQSMVTERRLMDGLVDAIPNLRANIAAPIPPTVLVYANVAHRVSVCEFFPRTFVVFAHVVCSCRAIWDIAVSDSRSDDEGDDEEPEEEADKFLDEKREVNKKH